MKEGGTVELRQVDTFRAVAEELSFSRAAVRLGYVQSSVSAQVAALEQELGVRLFDRLGRRGALTEAGPGVRGESRRALGPGPAPRGGGAQGRARAREGAGLGA